MVMKVIEPGYRRDPPAEVVGPVCQGDCGCSGCKGDAPAKSALKIVEPAGAKALTAVVQMEPSAASREVLRDAGLDGAPSWNVPASSRRGSSAVCWNARVIDGLVEQMLERYRWAPSLRGWVYATTAPARVTIGPGQPARPIFSTLQKVLAPSLRWILCGGLSVRETVSNEESAHGLRNRLRRPAAAASHHRS